MTLVLSAVPRDMENDNLDIIVIIGFWDLNSEAKYELFYILQQADILRRAW